MGYNWPVKRKVESRPFGPRNSKFNSVRTNGMGSKLEASVHQILKWRLDEGTISDIQCQVTVDLGTETVRAARTGRERTRTLRWKVDFSFYDLKAKRLVWCEAKGAKSALYKRQLRLWREGAGPGPLEIWEGHWKAPRLVETVVPCGS